MSDPAPNPDPSSPNNPAAQSEEDHPSQGPNLVVAYGLIALALLIAFGFAALIVWPFFKAR